MLVNSLASEPEIGSSSRGRIFATTAERTADGLVVNGRKTWSTGGAHLTHMIVGVMLGEEPTNVLVESHREGIEILETWDDALSLRATDNHDVFFRNVRVPADNTAALTDTPQRFQPPGTNALFNALFGGRSQLHAMPLSATPWNACRKRSEKVFPRCPRSNG